MTKKSSADRGANALQLYAPKVGLAADLERLFRGTFAGPFGPFDDSASDMAGSGSGGAGGDKAQESEPVLDPRQRGGSPCNLRSVAEGERLSLDWAASLQVYSERGQSPQTQVGRGPRTVKRHRIAECRCGAW